MLSDNTVTECGLDKLVVFPSSKRYEKDTVMPEISVVCPEDHFIGELAKLKKRLNDGTVSTRHAKVWLDMLKQSHKCLISGR